MTRVLALSSWVAAGHVGLSAAIPALQALRAEVVGLPTVMLSNHKAFAHCAGGPVPPAEIEAMLEAVAANGWLAGLDAVLTGYMPSAAHVEAAARAVAAVRAASPAAQVVVDPVLGDDPKGLYIPAEAAAAVAALLVPEADALTPNRFELAQITGRPAEDLAGAAEAARALAAARPGRRVIVTSPPISPEDTGALVATPDGSATLHVTRRREGAPNGAGDVVSALIAGGLGAGLAIGAVAALIEASLGAPHLAFATAQGWAEAAPVPGRPVA